MNRVRSPWLTAGSLMALSIGFAGCASYGTGASEDLAVLSDEFSGDAINASWTWLHDEEGWPDTLQSASVVDGHLELVPWTTAWYADFHGPMLFKSVTGNFVATARVLSSGLSGAIPEKTYSFTGLIAREPRSIAADTWVAGGENHVFITAGVGDHPGVPQVETKTTVDSRSTLTLKRVSEGWVDLAIVRSGETFVLLYRPTGEEWVVSDRFNRPDLGPELQLGLIVYTDWEDMQEYRRDPAAYHATVVKAKPDLRAGVDYLRFSPLPAGIDSATIRDAPVDELWNLVKGAFE